MKVIGITRKVFLGTLIKLENEIIKGIMRNIENKGEYKIERKMLERIIKIMLEKYIIPKMNTFFEPVIERAVCLLLHSKNFEKLSLEWIITLAFFS